jgi:hypothetical protein
MKHRSNTVFGSVLALFGESFDALPQLLKPLPKSLFPFLLSFLEAFGYSNMVPFL